MTTQAHNSRQPDSLDEAFELVSRQIDGDLSSKESSRLAAMEALSPSEIAGFRKRCQGLQAVLRQIPAQPVEKVLFRAPLQAKPLGGAWTSHRKGVVWGSITVVVAGCLFLAFAGPLDSPPSTDVDRAIASNAEFLSPEISSDAVGSSNEPVEFISKNRSAKDAGSNPVIQPLFESGDWNIVVVRLDVKDRDLAMDRIQSIVLDLGLRLQNSAGDGRSDVLGVVTTSAVSDNDALVSEMEKRVAHSPVQRDSHTMEEARRQEIIAHVRKSLQSPTQSELHHGKVYLALSTIAGRGGSATSADLAQSSAAPAVNAAAEDRKVALAQGSSGKSGDPEDADGRVAASSKAAITLIVFEFRSDESNPAGETSGKQI